MTYFCFLATHTPRSFIQRPDIILSKIEADHFVEKGWLKVEQAIPRRRALIVRDHLRDSFFANAINDDVSNTHFYSRNLTIKREFSGEPFDLCLTPRLKEYLDALTMPYGRDPHTDIGHWGWWTVNTRYGADLPWDIPSEGWHWDGLGFEHSVTGCHRVGILMLCLFSDVETRGGATLLAEGTHRAAIGVLNRAGRPLAVDDAIARVGSDVPWVGRLTGAEPLPAADVPTEGSGRLKYFSEVVSDRDLATDFRVVEATGGAGDIYLCHPFLMHSGSYNHRPEPRYLCNRFAPFRGPLTLERDSQGRSILDRVVHQALGEARWQDGL